MARLGADVAKPVEEARQEEDSRAMPSMEPWSFGAVRYKKGMASE